MKKARLKKAKAWSSGVRVPRKRNGGAARAPAPRKAKAPPRRPPPPPTPALRPFQREGVDFLAEHNWRVLLADAPGCGKTGQVLTAIKENVRRLCPALAVVPASVVQNWRNEAEMWIPGVRVQIAADVNAPLERNHHLTITTWDVLASRQEEFIDYTYRLLVADEAHYAKNPKAQRTQAVEAVAQSVDHMLLLTGTPLVNTVDELEVLWGLFGTENPPMLRRLLEDVAPDIPAKKRVTLRVEIPDEILHEYREVVALYEQWLEAYLPKIMDDPIDVEAAAERATSSEPLSKLTYLRRIIGRGKIPAAVAWTLSMIKKGEPVVIFGQYTDVLDLLGQYLSKLGVTYTRLDGSSSTEQRQASVDAFRSGQVDVFIGSRAAAEGITLVRAANLLFLERWWTPAAEEQAEDRIRRLGQKRPTTIWYLHADGTLDDRITDIVERKRALVAQHIGTATIEHQSSPETLSVWRKIKELSKGVPLVSHNPKAALDLPPLPDNEKIVHSVIFDATRWPIDALQRHLRRNRYRTRKIKRQNHVMQIIVRSTTGFVPNTIRRVKLAEGIILEIGKPLNAADAAARMRLVRAERKRRGVSVLTNRKVKPKVLRAKRL